MKKLGFILVFALAFFIITSLAYGKPPAPPPAPPATIFYYGYAVLYDNDGTNPYMIVSDGKGQYVDRNFASGNWRTKRGDKIEVQLKYNSGTTGTKGYDLVYFRCFIGKPELNWRSDRRARFNFDVNGAAKGGDYLTNQTVADMLVYNNVKPFPSELRGRLNYDSVHIAFQKGWGTDYNECWAAVLVDKTDVTDDPNAITRTNLLTLDPNAPFYWTSLEGSSFGSEEDAHDHIAYFMYESKLNFKVLLTERQGSVDVPIKWEVTPDITKPVEDTISVRTTDSSPQPPMMEPKSVLYNFPNGLPFKLIVSKYTLVSPAPSKERILTGTWGDIRGE